MSYGISVFLISLEGLAPLIARDLKEEGRQDEAEDTARIDGREFKDYCEAYSHQLSNGEFYPSKMEWLDKLDNLMKAGGVSIEGNGVLSCLIYRPPDSQQLFIHVDDFPSVGHIKATEAAAASEKLAELIEQTLPLEESEVRALQQLASWLNESSQKQLDLIGFYE